jgi:cytochrome c5
MAVPPEDPGAAVWKKTCAQCHDGGLGDGPAIGDAAAWKPRTAQGMAVLRDHALNGFTGVIGDMPARGGDDTLTDADVWSALTYMVAKSR